MSAHRTLVEDPARGVALEVLIVGEGPDVLLLPSAQRGAADFEQLQPALAAAGYRSVAVNPRGAGASSVPQTDVTLHDLVDDVAMVIDNCCTAPCHLVGHAFGNIVARATASARPELVWTIALLPCGGHNLRAHPVSARVLEHFPRCGDESLSRDERLESLQIAFFAPGNDASSWLSGWWPASAPLGGAIERSDPEAWWRGGTVPVLIVHPLDDAMLSVAASRETVAALGERVTYVELPECGHALLPEQPKELAAHLVGFLRSHPTPPAG